MRNDIQSVVPGKENVARAPTEFTAEGLESLNKHLAVMCRYPEIWAQLGISNI